VSAAEGGGRAERRRGRLQPTYCTHRWATGGSWGLRACDGKRTQEWRTSSRVVAFWKKKEKLEHRGLVSISESCRQLVDPLDPPPQASSAYLSFRHLRTIIAAPSPASPPRTPPCSPAPRSAPPVALPQYALSPQPTFARKRPTFPPRSSPNQTPGTRPWGQTNARTAPPPRQPCIRPPRVLYDGTRRYIHGGQGESLCLLIHTEASLSLSLSPSSR